MIRISREQRIYSFSPAHPPVATIQPGETVIFETEDAGSHRIVKPEDILTYVPRPDYTNPATGPVYVMGAEPGDALSVHIDRIELDKQGYTKISPGAGLLIHEVMAPAVQIWRIMGEPGNYWISWNEYMLPARPMIGTIGTAPASESAYNYFPGPHGGNLDVPAITEGVTVYLPVHVAGAFLALGDVHARQGDGEISGVALEARAIVTTRVELLKEVRWERPWIESPDAWITVGEAPSAQEAMEMATRDMMRLLKERLSMPAHDALMLLGVAGDMRPGQSIFAPMLHVTYYLTLPKPIPSSSPD